MGVDQVSPSGGGGIDLSGGTGLIGLPTHHVNYESGLTDQEIARLTLGSGERLEVWRLDLQLRGGGSDANVSIDIYDVDAGGVIASTTAGSRVEGGTAPIGTSLQGSAVLVRVTTDTAAVDACPSAITRVVES